MTRAWRLQADRIGWAIAITWWTASILQRLWLLVFEPETRAGLFADGRLYRLASQAWLDGRDPWGQLGMHFFAAPPPTLLLMAPLAFIPEPVAIALLELVLIAGAVWTVRHLRLPWVFLLWPPLWGSVMVGNPNALLVGLLVTAIAPLAVVFKVYAIVPLIALRRWRAVAVSGALLAVTAIVLPWATYLREFGTIDGHLEEQARHLSAWGEPMILLVIPALFVLGRRRASWLAVPGLWPSTQLGYHVLALPVMRNPWVAIGLSIPVPLVAPATIVAWAGVRLARARGPRLVSALRALGARPDSGLDVAS